MGSWWVIPATLEKYIWNTTIYNILCNGTTNWTHYELRNELILIR